MVVNDVCLTSQTNTSAFNDYIQRGAVNHIPRSSIGNEERTGSNSRVRREEKQHAVGWRGTLVLGKARLVNVGKPQNVFAS